MTDKERFKRDLLELGVKPGDMVLVHSSMKALGTECAPEEIIDAMEEVLGEEGTLLMPALTYENVTAERQRRHGALHRAAAQDVPAQARRGAQRPPHPLRVRQREDGAQADRGPFHGRHRRRAPLSLHAASALWGKAALHRGYPAILYIYARN